MNADVVARNQESVRHLKELVAHLTDGDLARSVGDGWTVSTALAHLAYWDRRAAILLTRWQKQGITPDDSDSSVINEASAALWSAVPPRAAAQIAIDSADAANKAVAALSDDMAQQIMTGNAGVALKRFEHREEHIEQIQKALGTH